MVEGTGGKQFFIGILVVCLWVVAQIGENRGESEAGIGVGAASGKI